MAKEPFVPANGIKLDDLVVGGLYECRVSGRKVLITLNRERTAEEKEKYPRIPGDRAVKGAVMNFVKGEIEAVSILDYQLKFPTE